MELKSRNKQIHLKNAYDVNYYWLLLVLVHLSTMVVASVMTGLPMGSMVLMLLIWMLAGYALIKNIAYYDIWGKDATRSRKVSILFALGCAVSVAFLSMIPPRYMASGMQKLLLLDFYMFVCWKEIKKLDDNISIHRPKLVPCIIILVESILIFVIASYFNRISMLFVSNHVIDSLSVVKENLAGSIVVLAVLPAIVEELLFRGYMMKNISNKKKAVLVSAVTFALLHCDLNQMGYAFVSGVLLALVIVYTDNVLYSMGLHILFNLANVLLMWIPASSPIADFFEMKIMGYAFLNPIFVLADGSIQVKMIAIGSVITIIAIVLFVLLLKVAGSYCLESKEETSDEKPWRPDAAFFLGCVLCLLVAFLYEQS